MTNISDKEWFNVKNYNKIIIGCLVVLILLQGAGLAVNFQEKRMLAEKLEAYEEKVNSYDEKMEKVDTLLSEIGELLEKVNSVMDDVNEGIGSFSLFK